MPDDDWQLAQGTVDFRNEERMARFECGFDDIDESAGLMARPPTAPLALCTCDEHCAAQADEHLENCPVEKQLKDDLGF